MKEAQRITLRWDARTESPAQLAKHVADTLTWFASVEPLSGEWSTTLGRPGDVKKPEVASATPAVIEKAIDESAFPPKQSGPPACYEQETYLGTYRRHRAKLRLVVFTGGQPRSFPNRIELALYEKLDVEALRKTFLGMVAAFRPAYGFSSVDRVPASGPPPLVGFLTFLDASFAVPMTLADDVHVAPLASLGTLIQLSTKPVDSASDEYKQRLAALQAVLAG